MGCYNFLKGTAKLYDIFKSAVTTLCMGVIAGTITVYATQPFDVLTTRSQSVQGALFNEETHKILERKQYAIWPSHLGVVGFCSLRMEQVTCVLLENQGMRGSKT